MTVKEKKRSGNLLKARLKDKIAMNKASMGIDALRAKLGRPSAEFDSLRLLRQLRASRWSTFLALPWPSNGSPTNKAARVPLNTGTACWREGLCCLYIALASQLGARLLTADEALYKKARPFVPATLL